MLLSILTVPSSIDQIPLIVCCVNYIACSTQTTSLSRPNSQLCIGQIPLCAVGPPQDYMCLVHAHGTFQWYWEHVSQDLVGCNTCSLYQWSIHGPALCINNTVENCGVCPIVLCDKHHVVVEVMQSSPWKGHCSHKSVGEGVFWSEGYWPVSVIGLLLLPEDLARPGQQ